MAFKIANLTREVTPITWGGTGDVELDGVPASAVGHRSFSDAVGDTHTCFFMIWDGAGNWEVSEGVFSAGSPNTLTRATVLDSSAGGAKVNFSAGVKDVVLIAPASRLVMRESDDAVNINSGETLSINSGATLDVDAGATVNGITDTLDDLAKTLDNFVVADGSAWVVKTAAQVRSILGLGALALLNTVDTAQIDNDAITAAKIAAGQVGSSEIASSAVGATEIAADAVRQSEIKVTSGDQYLNTKLESTGTAVITVTGGVWSFNVFVTAYTSQEVYTSGTSLTPANYRYGIDSYQVDYTCGILQGTTPATTSSYRQNCQYVSASPPYDLGDGDVPLFVFVEMFDAGDGLEARRIYVAVDPPWIDRGPTLVRPNFKVGKTDYVRQRQIIAEHGSLRGAIAAGVPRPIALDRINTDPFVDVAVTRELKNADMAVVPHPFHASWDTLVPGEVGHPSTGRHPLGPVFLLDPMHSLGERLLAAQDLGDPEENVIDLILGGHIRIGPVIPGRAGPPGVPVRNFTLR